MRGWDVRILLSFAVAVSRIQGALQTFFCIDADANNVLWLQDFKYLLQVSVAGRIEWLSFRCGKLVRRSVAGGFFHEDERAIVADKMPGKEFACSLVFIGEQSPQTSPADFAALALESGDDTFGVLVFADD